MGSHRRPESRFPRLGALAGKIAVSLVMLGLGLTLDALGLHHGDKIVFVALLMLITFTLQQRR